MVDRQSYFFRNVSSFLEDFNCVIQTSKKEHPKEKCAIEYVIKLMTDYLETLKETSAKNRVTARKRTSVPSKLRSLRLQRGLTLKGLAILAGMSPSYISYIEKGKVPRKKNAMKNLAFALCCSVADLSPDECLDKGGGNKE